MHRILTKPSRRSLRTRLSVCLAAILAAAGINGVPATAGADATSPDGNRSVVRVLTVGAINTGGLFTELVADFERKSKHRVQVSTGGVDIFDRARAGEADIVLAHWGFSELEEFVSDGEGRWPSTILSNVVVFIVPPDDPADVAGAADPVQAFERIAAQRSPFVVNDLGETRYVTDTLWNAAGRPSKGDWFLDLGLRGPAAVRAAEQRGGYTLWGLHPFLRMKQQEPVDMEAAPFDDSLLQRIIASVVVTPSGPHRTNVRGALAFEKYLTKPATQAMIRGFRLPGIDQPVFWPAANNNDN